MKIEKYLLPAFWAPALINSDETDMEDSDVEAMNAWLDEIEPGYCIGCSDDESNFTSYHDASNHVLACNCLEYSFEDNQK